VCRLVNGRAFKPSEWTDSGLPIVRIQNLNDPTKPFNYFDGPVDSKHVIDDGDILLSWSGTPGTSFGCFIWERSRAVLNQHIFKVQVDKERIADEYFVLAVNSKLDEMISKAHGGVGLRHITKDKLEAIHLPVPPIDEQRRLVRRVKEMFERVDEIERLRSETRLELGYLPISLCREAESIREWPCQPVGELVYGSRNGRSIRADGRDTNGAVLTLSAVRQVVLDCACRKEVPLDKTTATQFTFQAGEVFVSRSNTRDLVGLSAIAECDAPANLIYPDLLIKLTPDEEKVRPRYLAYALRFPTSRDQIRARAKGTSQSMVKISGASLKEVTIPVPPLEEQDRLVSGLDVGHEMARSIRDELATAPVNALRKAILRKAFAGEL
jgi:type I restriction enzyme S subunit